MSATSYMRWFFGAAAALAALVACLAVTADPYYVFGTRAFEIKPRVYSHGVLAKTLQLERTRPRTLLLGNSRTEIGFDPESSQWPQTWQPVFNAAQAGGSLATDHRLLQHAIAVNPPETVILGLDIQDFLERPHTAPADAPPPGPDERRLLVDRGGGPNPARSLQRVQDMFVTTLTLDAFLDSVLTVAGQDRETGVTMTPAGFNPLRDYGIHVSRIGHHGLFEQKMAAYFRQYAQKPRIDFVATESSEEFQTLRAILELAAAHRIRLVLHTHPYHAAYLDMLRELGLWESFEGWKRAVVRTLESNERFASVEFLDFSGYSEFAREQVPQLGDRTTAMRWYWEPGHYKSALGELMIARIVGQESCFGTPLRRASISHAGHQ